MCPSVNDNKDTFEIEDTEMGNDIITSLRNKLGAIPTTNFKDYFDDIAKLLMNNCVIKKCNYNKNCKYETVEYEIVEVEFYLFTPEHQDVITYPRKLPAGQWFFHPSGVDLTFESNDKHFGGILIRGIRNIETGILTLGPQKCVDLLWDKSDAFKIQENEYPIIDITDQKLNENISFFPRWIPVKDEDKAKKLNYWAKRIHDNGYEVCAATDKTNIVFERYYRFIKSDLINNTTDEWKDYSAKPRLKNSHASSFVMPFIV